MIRLLNKISKHRIRIEVVDGKLKLYAENNTVDTALIQEIKANKDALIKYLSETITSSEIVDTLEYIPTIEKAKDYEMSSSQKRLWIISQFKESSITYNLPFSIELPKIKKSTIEKALYALVERHEILRTVFITNEQVQTRQKVIAFEQVSLNIQHFDFSLKKDALQEISTWIDNDTHKAFDLEKFPLFNVALFETGKENNVLYFNIHHIIFDGWSLDVLKKEFLHLCRIYQERKHNDLPALPLQYKDYASYQNKKLHSGDFKKHKNYWLQKLSNPLPILNIPTEKKRPVLKTYNGVNLYTIISPKNQTRLTNFLTKNNGSLFSGLLSIWYLLLHKYSNQKEIIIGTPVAGREHWSLMDQIGFYINMLPLKIVIDPNKSFLSFYNHLKTTIVSDFEHQAYPFDALVNDLKIIRDNSRNVVFDVMMTQGQHQEENINEEYAQEDYEKINDLGKCFVKFDMEIECVKRENNITLSFKYNSDIYEQQLMEQFVLNYHQLLTNVLESPKESIKNISCISNAEKSKLLTTFSQQQNNYLKVKPNVSFLDMFKAQVLRHPHATAITCNDKKISYTALETNANNLATFLQKKHNIRPNDFIGIQLLRDEWLVIVILGILKTSAAYIPLPKAIQEQQKIKEDSGYKLLIDDEFITTYNLVSEEYQGIPNTKITSDKLAYIIYTSGTTGKPKGVMVSHANLYAFLENLDSNFGMGNLDTFAATTKITFDISVLEILGTLSLGKELVMFSDEHLKDPEIFLQALNTYQIEGLQLTPSRLKQLQYISDFSPKSLKLLLVGGEAMSTNMFTDLKAKNFEVYNVYGPTETTIWSTCLHISKSKELSIGTPLKEEVVYILDEYLNVLPIGVKGELYIGGKGVSKGYLNQTEQTNENFIVSPFNNQEYIYKTGDMGKWDQTGAIKLLGRKDNQIKIRGHRIELDEITNTLQKNKKLEQVVLTIKTNKQGENSIVAFFTSKEKQDSSELSLYAKSKLPDYKVPSHFIQLSEFKLNTSGKIDTNTLKKYDVQSLVNVSTYKPPESNEEKIITTIWSKVLEIPFKNISIKDDFYNLGGDSVSSIRVLSELKVQGYLLEIKDILLYPILEALAKKLKIQELNAHDFKKIKTEWAVFSNYNHISELAPNYVVIHEGNGELFGYRLLFEQLKDTHNIWGFVMEKESLSPTVVTTEAISEAYANIIKSVFNEHAEIHLLGWSYGGYIAYQMVNYFEEKKLSITIKSVIMVDTMNYLDTNYHEFYQEAFFEKDHSLTLSNEKALVKAICPEIDIESIQADTIETFWTVIAEEITQKTYDFIIPEYWAEHFKKLYPNIDIYTAFEKINQLRTIGLNLPIPYTNSVKNSHIMYIKAKGSEIAHQEYWDNLTTASFEATEVLGTHGALMQEPYVNGIVESLIKTKIEL